MSHSPLCCCLMAGAPWGKHDNHCVSADGGDQPQTRTQAGDTSRSACQQLCQARDECSAFEWYDSPSSGKYYGCHLMLGSTPSTKGSSDRRWKDAECHVKPADSTMNIWDWPRSNLSELVCHGHGHTDPSLGLCVCDDAEGSAMKQTFQQGDEPDAFNWSGPQCDVGHDPGSLLTMINAILFFIFLSTLALSFRCCNCCCGTRDRRAQLLDSHAKEVWQHKPDGVGASNSTTKARLASAEKWRHWGSMGRIADTTLDTITYSITVWGVQIKNAWRVSYDNCWYNVDGTHVWDRGQHLSPTGRTSYHCPSTFENTLFF